MSEWVKESPGEYVNGDYRIERTGINPNYPWEVFLRATVIELTRTLGEAKLATDALAAFQMVPEATAAILLTGKKGGSEK